jgi:hypothetical protein
MNIKALIAAAGSALLALIALACVGPAESPEPTIPASAVASPSATPQQTVELCERAPATPPASLHYQSGNAAGMGVLEDVKIESQDCFDRVTFTFSGDQPSYDAQYVQDWTECGSGAPVTTAGPAQLAITFIPANAHTDAGAPTITGTSRMLSLPSLKEAEQTCDFEAHVSWVFGTEERYFTVSTADSPPRVIVDVRH